MNIQQILEEIDVLYSQQKVDEVAVLLEGKIPQLKEAGDVAAVISLMNELLGIYREKGDSEHGATLCLDLLQEFRSHRLPEDEHYATTLLNIATANRAFGQFDEARKYYKLCQEIYQVKLPEHDYRFASLYNNLSLLYSEMGVFPKALTHLERSLEILSHHQGVDVQVATGNTSLAQISVAMGDLEQAQKYIEIALGIFSKEEDYHFSAALATAAEIELMYENYTESAFLYQKAMSEIEKYLGKTGNYEVLAGYLQEVEELQEKAEQKEKQVAVLVDYEWKAFDKVQGVDGRATCQDDFETFQIMRSSQFYVWEDALCESYREDLESAQAQGRNLVSEKYGFMMESNDPQGFEKIRQQLPEMSSEKEREIEEILTLQMAMVLALEKKYPRFVSQGRSLRREEDSIYNTSYETYLRGELCSYSEKTVKLYLEMLKNHQKEGINTAKRYMEQVAKQYGYLSLKSAEAAMMEQS